MRFLVIGQANSGKSALAEELAVGTGDRHRIYLATMKVCDEEGEKRVRRHRESREGKGFITIEKESDIPEILKDIAEPEDTTVLLECVSNLVGNEMHKDRKKQNPGENGMYNDDKEIFADRIAEDIGKLSDNVHNLIIVTNEYPCEEGYDDETRMYVELLNMVNDRLMAKADRIYDLRKG
ncbi:MAG: bifunctional adenosylcobinamide kinase/adenosylcobinamide-phosphate guanylyltransferase [Lachnospiraceae bacterium]|nr:bifunctional adenosylcobinamide kinase/adenosylcobinamide-phosphate guanylyltransferase [Lachnospiraceae bacterium]